MHQDEGPGQAQWSTLESWQHSGRRDRQGSMKGQRGLHSKFQTSERLRSETLSLKKKHPKRYGTHKIFLRATSHIILPDKRDRAALKPAQHRKPSQRNGQPMERQKDNDQSAGSEQNKWAQDSYISVPSNEDF